MTNLTYPKGPSRHVRYDAKRKHRADIIRAVRVQVMQRDVACRVCGSTRDAEMHEIVPRSLLRGQPPEEVYTTQNCIRLCAQCHGKVQRHEIALHVADPVLGADGRCTRVIEGSRHVPTPTSD